MRNANKLGYYLWKRINQDQENYRKTRPPNIRGLYFNRKDLDSYIRDRNKSLDEIIWDLGMNLPSWDDDEEESK